MLARTASLLLPLVTISNTPVYADAKPVRADPPVRTTLRATTVSGSMDSGQDRPAVEARINGKGSFNSVVDGRGATRTAATMQAHEAAGLRVTCIGNEGFLITTGRRKVLVDSVFGPPEAPPLPEAPPPDILDKIKSGETPFDNIDLMLVTHAHPDHFVPRAHAAQLLANSKTVLVGPVDAAELIEQECGDYDKIRSRIRTDTPWWGARVEMNLQDIRVSVLGLRHADEVNYDLSHRAYLIEVGGFKILHLGDALATRANFAEFGWLADEEIDLAFIPYWLVRSEEGVTLVKDVIRPKHVVAMHIPFKDAQRWATGVKRAERDLGADIAVFTSRMETRAYGVP